MKYREYRRVARTGDILLFQGRSFISGLIRAGQDHDFSHVAMTLIERGSVLCYESTTENTARDVEEGRILKGVSIVPLSARLASYNGEVYVKRLRKATPFSVDQQDTLYKIREEFKGKPYETSLCEILLSAYDGPFGENTRNISSLFCSELVAEVMIALGWLPPLEEKSSNEYDVDDFAEVNVPRGTHQAIECLEV